MNPPEHGCTSNGDCTIGGTDPEGSGGTSIECAFGQVATQDLCAETTCSCADSCASGEDCLSGCCANGYCALTCTCDLGGDVLYECNSAEAYVQTSEEEKHPLFGCATSGQGGVPLTAVAVLGALAVALRQRRAR
jgi:MYXO-CTERM domain-containing protein